jgi:rubrerythrin
MNPNDSKEKTMSKGLKWQCTVCGLTEQGATPPKTCSKCGVKSDRFIKIK